VSAVFNLLLQRETAKRTRAFIERGVTPDMIREIAPDGQRVGKHEFVAYLLVGQGKLKQDDVTAAVALFTCAPFSLDPTQTAYLPREPARRMRVLALNFHCLCPLARPEDAAAPEHPTRAATKSIGAAVGTFCPRPRVRCRRCALTSHRPRLPQLARQGRRRQARREGHLVGAHRHPRPSRLVSSATGLRDFNPITAR
jgi:hypothetical protein